MKQIICILSIMLFCVLQTIQAQSVFPNKNARWEVLVPAPYYTPHDRIEGAPLLTGTEKGNAALIYTIGTDSIIGVNDKVYYNLYIDSLYAGSVRVNDKQVWITADNGSHETLLYDFGVKEGDVVKRENHIYLRGTPFYTQHPLITRDTIQVWYGEEYDFLLDEYNVEVVKVNEGIYGKEIIVRGTFYDTWCEGIGSLHGMFLTTSTTTNGSVFYGGCLWKLFVDENRIYPEQELGSVEDRLTTENLSILATDYLLFHPEGLYYDGQTQVLQLLGAEKEIVYTLEVSSLSGYHVIEEEISSTINLSTLPMGWYVCKLRKKNQIISIIKIQR